jgi:hypothetical protein
MVADWYYITSENGWTDNHIAVEWLKEVYLPQTRPSDESDARLLIVDCHGSHVSASIRLSYVIKVANLKFRMNGWPPAF